MSRNNDLWVLGISASPHNGAVCLLRNDEIVVAVQEERLTRIKRAPVYGALPSMAIDYCLKYAGIRAANLDIVVSCVTNRAKTPEQDVSVNPIFRNLQDTPILYLPHHYGHALSVFATSGFGESAILIVDGQGSPFEDLTQAEKAACKWPVDAGWETTSLYRGEGTSIIPLEKQLVNEFGWLGNEKDGMRSYGSLGGMYAAVAHQIFGNIHEAGKVMGLAPYGRAKIPAREFFETEAGRFTFEGEVRRRFRHNGRWPEYQEEYSNLSASVQVALEEAVLQLTQRLYDMYPSDNLCYAGGVALNSVANERIIRESGFKNVCILPAAEDSGTSIGAAYYGLWRLTGKNTRRRLIHDALGRTYSGSEILAAVEETPASELVHSENCIAETVQRLSEGKIIGWFEGRSELGPRSLGQRSILCDARRPDAKDVLNRQVKHRESFRPFAPVVLLERVKEWFDLEGASPESPFMLRVCKFRDERKAEVPGVVHVDGTGRLQTVTPDANGTLYRLTSAFKEKTGVPIILNTSFNVAGEPIVETPQDALNALLSTGIDFCVLENQLVQKRKEILFERNEIPWPQRLMKQIATVLSGTRATDGGAAGTTACEVDAYLGSFEHSLRGKIVIERKATGMQASFIHGRALRSNLSSSDRKSVV